MNTYKSDVFLRLLHTTPFSKKELVSIINTSPRRYKTFLIEKKNGRGNRLIAQPSPEVKLLQRTIIKNEFSEINIHGSAKAYMPGISIKDHAKEHSENRYLLKIDFKDFFHSIKPAILINRLEKDGTTLTSQDQRNIVRILFFENKGCNNLELSIGAPSSPLISNYIMYDFDNDVNEFCLHKNAIYTRYSDDLAISTSRPHILNIIYEFIVSIIEKKYSWLIINTDKTVNVSTKRRRVLTGLTLCNDGTVSIGRNKKRNIRASIYNLRNKQNIADNYSYIRGMLAFVNSIDREFYLSMIKKLTDTKS
jgi:RNA-directed DNA polymerase